MSSTSSSDPVLPDKNDTDTAALFASHAPFISLKYAPDKKCICFKQNKFELATAICPQHGYHDSKSKIIKRKGSCFAADSKKRKESNTQDRNYAPRQSRTRNISEPHPQNSSNLLCTRHSNRTNNAVAIATRSFTAELGLMNDSVRRVLVAGNVSDDHMRCVQIPERAPLTQIDFLEWPLSARKIIYRYLLVPAKGAVIFPNKNSNETFRQLNPGLDIRILYTNSQVYSEARTILYSENNFTAAKPTDFFCPTGIRGLRASTAKKIKHISFLRRGSGPQLCEINSEELSTSIHSTILQCPSFLKLDTLTIRFEVLRPLTISMFKLQVHFASNGFGGDIKSAYNKTDVIMNAAATIAYKALRRKSPFQGLRVVEDRFERTVVSSKERCLKHVTEVCLFRTSKPLEEYQEQSQTLREAILDMLFEEKEKEVQGADERFRDFVRRYPE